MMSHSLATVFLILNLRIIIAENSAIRERGSILYLGIAKEI